MSLLDVLELIGPPLRKLILTSYGPDSCIASTRIGIDVLEGLGLTARPLMVEAQLFNAPMLKLLESGVLDDMHDQAERERLFDETGAWGMGIGMRDPKRTDLGPLNGIHVVAIVQEYALWDLAIDQASRPQHNMAIGRPLAVQASDGFLQGTEALVISEAHDLGAVRYRPKPKDTRYTLSPNWQPDGHDAGRRAEIVDAALARLRQPDAAAHIGQLVTS